MSYQAEERYWTDYLRIALPIVGLLLLLSVFWYWASSFIGDDGDTPPPTEQALVQTTPIEAPTSTPTTSAAIQITPQTLNPTEAAEITGDPTEAPATTDGETAEQTPVPDDGESTGDGSGTLFAIDEIAVINESDVNMRGDPTTDSEIVDTLVEGTELRILDAVPVEADGYSWWFVEDTLNGVQGWVAQDFVDKQ